MYSPSVKNRLVAFVLIATFLLQNCNIYRKTPVTAGDVRNGIASPVEIVTFNGKVHRFDHLSFDKENIYGIRYIRLRVINVPIPRDRIQYIRMKKVMIRFKDGHKEYFKYLQVNQGDFTGISMKHNQLNEIPVDTAQIDEIHLLNAKVTGIVNGLIIIGGFSLLAFIIFPYLHSNGLLPQGYFDLNP